MIPRILPVIFIALLADTAGRATSTRAQPPTAAQIVARIAECVPDATPGVIYTPDTDPNHIMGRPGGYVSKASFTDQRIDPEGAGNAKKGSVRLGGSVEVFTDKRGAQRRKDYIHALSKGFTDIAEYDYVAGPVLVRVTKALTPSQAREYQEALGEISG